jgi:opacity protein-like surface antigen
MMAKKIAAAFVCVALGSSLYAKEVAVSEKFIGLEVGAATVQGDIGGYFPEYDHDGSDVELGFRLGAQINEWRTMLIFDYFDSSDDDQNYEKGLLSFDYFFLNSNQGEYNAFRPYIGVNVGYMNYEATDVDVNGFVYGGQVGFAYRVAEHVDIDLMYRYSLTSGSDDQYEADHIGSVLFGINYIY